MGKDKRNGTKYIALSGIIAALYIALSLISMAFGISYGPVQVRFSEALCILPVFLPAAIPGLTIGCLLSNLIMGCALWDVLFGTIATLLGALGTYYLGKKPLLALVPPIVSNTIIVPLILRYAYSTNLPLWVLMISVGAGEIISAGVLGRILYLGIKKSGMKFE